MERRWFVREIFECSPTYYSSAINSIQHCTTLSRGSDCSYTLGVGKSSFMRSAVAECISDWWMNDGHIYRRLTHLEDITMFWKSTVRFFLETPLPNVLKPCQRNKAVDLRFATQSSAGTKMSSFPWHQESGKSNWRCATGRSHKETLPPCSECVLKESGRT